MRSLTQLSDRARWVVAAVDERARTSGLGWVGLGWFWVSVLLVLPNCSFSRGLEPPEDRSTAIFCEIEKERKCASQLSDAERQMAIRLAAAAIKLTTNENSYIGLDESPDARARCGGEPEAVIYYGPFPRGYTSCVNCDAAIGNPPNAQAACVAQCLKFFGTVGPDGAIIPNNPPHPADQAYCESHTKVATNAPADGCFANICTTGGAELPDFVDPRRDPEPVVWTDFVGTAATGADLARTAPTTGLPDAGAASTQRVTRGDAYVEFSASSTTRAQLVGLASDPPGCPTPCADTNATPNDVSFAITLADDGRMYVLESGVQVIGPGAGGSFRNFTAGQRFRVTVEQRADGTGAVKYSRIVNGGEETIYMSTLVARYPFRVDASFLQQGATVNDVRIVRIQ